MPRPEQVGADVFAAAQQIARRFFLLGRDVDGGERAGAIEERELRRIAAIGFNAVAGTARNEGSGR